MADGPSASQTVGPFFHYGLVHEDMRLLPAAGAANERVAVAGRMLDGGGAPVADALLEFWHPSSGFARAATDAEGRYALSLPKPRPDTAGGAGYFAVIVFARGLLAHLHTRCYLPDQGEVLAADAVLRSVPAARRPTLVGRPEGEGIRFDVVLQGDGETVFFAV